MEQRSGTVRESRMKDLVIKKAMEKGDGRDKGGICGIYFFVESQNV
jgi:hypothetical protein